MAKRGAIAIRQSHVLILAAGASLFVAAPAFARSSIAISEPTDLALFALGVTGLIIGRRGARRKPPRD